MSQVIYVNEYLPSKATLKLSGDSIYQKSAKSGDIRVLGAPSPLPLLAVGSGIAILALFLYLGKK